MLGTVLIREGGMEMLMLNKVNMSYWQHTNVNDNKDSREYFLGHACFGRSLVGKWETTWKRHGLQMLEVTINLTLFSLWCTERRNLQGKEIQRNLPLFWLSSSWIIAVKIWLWLCLCMCHHWWINIFSLSTVESSECVNILILFRFLVIYATIFWQLAWTGIWQQWQI